MQSSKSLLSEELRGVSHHRLDERDKMLREIHSKLKRMFFFQRFLNKVSIERNCISKGLQVSGSWVSQITVSNLTKTQAESIESLVEENEGIRVAVSFWKQEDESYIVELT
jgi:hypothetical protein